MRQSRGPEDRNMQATASNFTTLVYGSPVRKMHNTSTVTSPNAAQETAEIEQLQQEITSVNQIINNAPLNPTSTSKKEAIASSGSGQAK